MTSKTLIAGLSVLILIVLVALALFSNRGPPKNTYTDPNGVFSFSYPIGWEKSSTISPFSGLTGTDQQGLLGPSISFFKGNGTAISVIFINLPLKEPIPKESLSQVLDQLSLSIEGGLNSTIADYNKISSKESMLSSLPARELVYEGTKSGKKSKVKSLITLSGKYSVVILFASDGYDANIKDADSIISSFKILK